MEATSLTDLADELLAKAHHASAHRAAATLHFGEPGRVRRTVIALTAGSSLGDHDSPLEATIQVLRGRVRLTAPDDAMDLVAGELAPIPAVRHGLDALDDSVVLLTVLPD